MSAFETKDIVEAIIENCLTKKNNMLQWHIVEAMQSTLQESLQASYSISNTSLKYASFNVIKHALGEVVGFSWAARV